jgi:glycerophosphoryl diester phosphodiesterase
VFVLLSVGVFCRPAPALAQRITAHRGASYDAPENTLAAFTLAWQRDADGIEGDFHLTLDEQVVCLHDATTERTGDTNLTVATSTLAQLKAVDVGSWKGPEWAGERIPTLAEVLAVVPAGKYIQIEIKAGTEIVEPIAQVLKASSLANEQIMIICFSQAVVTAAKLRMPDYRVLWLSSIGDTTPTASDVLTVLRQTGADGLGASVNVHALDADFVNAVQANGTNEVHVWTVNDGPTASHFAGLGIDGITTDRPALIGQYVRGGHSAIAARVDVSPRSGLPTASVLYQTAGSDLWVNSGNEGDFDLGYPGAGIPILQANGVVIANCNELTASDDHGSVATAGELTGNPPGNSSNGGVWIPTFTAVSGGSEDNYDFSFAWFPYSEGWIGGHINAGGNGFLGSGNLPAGSSVSVATGPDYGGEVLLRLEGIDPRTDGMLFVVDGRNNDNVAAAAVPDGNTIEGSNSWHIAAFDESGNFDLYEQGQISFLYVPYSTEGLCGGWIGADGTKKEFRGQFSVTRTSAGRYEIVIRDGADIRYDDTDGILLVTVARLYEVGEPGTTSAGVDDNAVAWAYDPAADGGEGAFVVETYDLANWNSQDTEFVFAFVLYDGLFNVPGRSRGTVLVVK